MISSLPRIRFDVLDERAVETCSTFADLLDTLGIALCLFDDDDRAVLWNLSFLRFFPEHDGHVYVGEPYRENLRRFYETRLTETERLSLDHYVQEGIERHRAQQRPFDFSHHQRLLRVTSLPVVGAGRVRIWKEIEQDTPEEPASEVAPPLLSAFFDLVEGAVVLDKTGRITAANSEFLALYKIVSEASVIGRSFSEVVQGVWSRAGFAGPAAGLLDNMSYSQAPFEVELPGDRWCRVVMRHLSGGSAHLIHSDITAIKRRQRALAELAMSDELTGVGNRRYFDMAFDAHWQTSVQHAAPIAVAILDIDHFKTVNDRLGHPVGDECLKRVATIVRAHLRQRTDLLARLGGEEFVIIMPETAVAEAHAVVERLRTAISEEPWHEIHVDLKPLTISVGLCVVLLPETHMKSLIVPYADDMLYRAKREGRNLVRLCVLERQPGV